MDVSVPPRNCQWRSEIALGRFQQWVECAASMLQRRTRRSRSSTVRYSMLQCLRTGAARDGRQRKTPSHKRRICSSCRRVSPDPIRCMGDRGEARENRAWPPQPALGVCTARPPQGLQRDTTASDQYEGPRPGRKILLTSLAGQDLRHLLTLSWHLAELCLSV